LATPVRVVAQATAAVTEITEEFAIDANVTLLEGEAIVAAPAITGTPNAGCACMAPDISVTSALVPAAGANVSVRFPSPVYDPFELVVYEQIHGACPEQVWIHAAGQEWGNTINGTFR
jgi:hypothetical protein